jgi:uncharacterized membrane protein
MEALAVLVAIAGIVSLVASPIMALVALARSRRLREELEALRRAVARREERKPRESGAPAAVVPDLPRTPAAPPAPEAVRPSVPAAPPSPAPLQPAPVPVPLAASAAEEPAAATPRPTASIEEKLGAHFTVWLGAIAVALAAIFLVKYAFDNNLLTATTRVTLGALMGAVLLVAGEWLRPRVDRIGQGLSASGIAALYASVVAATSIYQLIDQTLGFAFVILITATAVLLSLRQGMIMALVGLVGGFLMPALLRTETPKPAALFTYLFVLELALAAVAFKKRWWGLSAAALAASMLWAVVWITGMHHGVFQASHGLWVGLFLILSATAFVLMERVQRAALPQAQRIASGFFSWAALGAGVVLLGFLAGATHFGTRELAFLWVLSAGCLALGRLDPAKDALAGMAAAFGAILFIVWRMSGIAAEEQLRFGLAVLAFGVLHAGGAYALLWGSVRPVVWAGLSSAAALGYCLIAYSELETLPFPLTWGGVSLLLASLYIAGALPVGRRRARLGDGALGACAIAATTFISLAVPLELEREWIAVAWALEVAALAWLESRLALPVMRYLGAAVAAAVAVRLLCNPHVLTYPIGGLVLFNWILYGYGVPIATLALAARIFRKTTDDRFVLALEGETIALGFAFLALQVRQYFHPTALAGETFYLAEWGSLAIAWLGYGLALGAFAERFVRPSLVWGGMITAGIGLLVALLFPCLGENPLWTRHDVGATPLWNSLLYVYGVPAALALLFARQLGRNGHARLAAAAAVAAIAIFFLLVSLQVRQAFHGAVLNAGPTTNPEHYAYSAAWIGFGFALLLVGILRRGMVARYASLAVMLAAIAKVFLFDMHELRDLYRVFSFLGLGVSLFVLAFLYQRFVFRRKEPCARQ